jgi:large subunit ribosomal protein L11
MKVKLIVEGGKMSPGPAVSQQLGPMGINLGKVISDVNEATKSFIGIKVPVELDVDAKTKSYEIEVFSPPVSELIKKELKLEKGSGQPNTIKVGNISIERLIFIADTKMSDLLARNMKNALKLIVGSCVSLGVLIDNKEPVEVEKEIDDGKYDKEIDNKITEVSEVKKNKLEKFFAVRKAKQEKDIKAAEEAAKAEEDAKAAATESAEGAKKTEGAEGEKKEEKVAEKKDEKK